MFTYLREVGGGNGEGGTFFYDVPFEGICIAFIYSHARLGLPWAIRVSVVFVWRLSSAS